MGLRLPFILLKSYTQPPKTASFFFVFVVSYALVRFSLVSMTLLQRFIFFRALSVFFGILVLLVGVVWTTQILRQLDLVTTKGQSLLQFLKMTALALPFFTSLVIPFALCCTLLFLLYQLHKTNMLIVLAAAGLSKRRVFFPFFTFCCLLSLTNLALSMVLAPQGLRLLRNEITQIRIDLLAQLIKPGQFVTLEQGIVFHVRERLPDGTLDQIFLQDSRKAESVYTYTAQRGSILESLDTTLLIMTEGTIQRHTPAEDRLSLIAYESYAFDLTEMTPNISNVSKPTYKPKELSLSEILTALSSRPPSETEKIRGEFHRRFVAGFLPLAFGAVIFALLGEARSTRQGQSVAFLSASGLCFGIWAVGFAAGILPLGKFWTPFFLYLPPLGACALGMFVILRDTLPRWLGGRLSIIW